MSYTKLKLRTQAHNEMRSGAHVYKTLKNAKIRQAELYPDSQLATIEEAYLVDAGGMVQLHLTEGDTEYVDVGYAAGQYASQEAQDYHTGLGNDGVVSVAQLALGDYSHAYDNHTDGSSAIRVGLLDKLRDCNIDKMSAIKAGSNVDKNYHQNLVDVAALGHIDRLDALTTVSQLGIYWLPPVENGAELALLMAGQLPNDGQGGTGDMRPEMQLGDAVVVKSVDALVLRVPVGEGVDMSEPQFSARLLGADADWDSVGTSLSGAGLNGQVEIILEMDQLGSIRTDTLHKYRTPAALQAAVFASHGTLDDPSRSYEDMDDQVSGAQADGSIAPLGDLTKEALSLAIMKRDKDLFDSELQDALTELASDMSDALEDIMELDTGRIISESFALTAEARQDVGDGVAIYTLTFADSEGAPIPFAEFVEGAHACEFQLFHNGIMSREVLDEGGFERFLGMAAGFNTAQHDENAFDFRVVEDDAGNAGIIFLEGNFDLGDEIQIHAKLAPSAAKVADLKTKLLELDVALHFEVDGDQVVRAL